jgi:hypothetical protein
MIQSLNQKSNSKHKQKIANKKHTKRLIPKNETTKIKKKINENCKDLLAN